MTAVVIQDSIANNKRITTLELEYPRFIHAELLTHRLFSRNSASSRAIPVERMLDMPVALPVYWGKNQPGMSAREEIEFPDVAETYWRAASISAKDYSKTLHDLGLHKQIANRVTEPFQMIKVVVTATEFDNWFELRNHQDAQPEIQNLAAQMLEAMSSSTPLELIQGDWHVPYVQRTRNQGQVFYSVNDQYLEKAQAKLVSASCCAQVSYRKSDPSIEKAIAIAQRLISGRPWHASPFEHQAKPMFSQLPGATGTWEPGITHQDRKHQYWSGNFCGWIQHRQLLEQASE